jgi:hypothetical protein
LLGLLSITKNKIPEGSSEAAGDARERETSPSAECAAEAANSRSSLPPKNRYVPLFGINLRRPITPAVRALLTQVLNLILINDVNNAIHALRNVLVRQQRSFFFVIVLYFSRIVVQTHTIIIYRYVIKMYVYMCDFFGIIYYFFLKLPFCNYCLNFIFYNSNSNTLNNKTIAIGNKNSDCNRLNK